MFDFTELIEDFDVKQTYIFEQTEGYYDYENGGIWVEGETIEIPIVSAVVPLSKGDLEHLEYRDNNAYVEQSKKMYTKHNLEVGSKIKHDDKVYTIKSILDYGEFDTDLGIYIVRRNESDD